MNDTQAPAEAPAKSHTIAGQVLRILLALVIGAVLAIGSYLYWAYEASHPSTQDAYLRAHYVWIAPRVSGQVIKIKVQDNQPVKAGDVLVEVDPRPFAAELTKAQSKLKLVRQSIVVQRATVEAAEARVKEQQARLDAARAESERVAKLVRRGDEPEIRGIQLEDQSTAAASALEDQIAELDVAKSQLGPEAIQQARVDQAQAAADLAQLNLDWTKIRAPADGWVTRVNLRVGDVVTLGQNLFPLVESDYWWVQANYKETQLEGIEPGMPARITIDIYGNRPFSGTVETIAPASAASFTLLPPENTTGNWVKVTQRIPVRIRMEPMDPDWPYRLGASVTATVDLPRNDPSGTAGDRPTGTATPGSAAEAAPPPADTGAAVSKPGPPADTARTDAR